MTNMMTMPMDCTMMGMGKTMTPPMSQPMNMMMVPRCTITMEKCAGGMKMMCACPDAMSKSMLQNLCNSMSGAMLSCCMMMNGMMTMCCNMNMCMCKCEMTADGCCFTCTSGDTGCCEMCQKCCDCMMAMMKCGCTCCLCMNGMPVCCCTCA